MPKVTEDDTLGLRWLKDDGIMNASTAAAEAGDYIVGPMCTVEVTAVPRWMKAEVLKKDLELTGVKIVSVSVDEDNGRALVHCLNALGK